MDVRYQIRTDYTVEGSNNKIQNVIVSLGRGIASYFIPKVSLQVVEDVKAIVEKQTKRNVISLHLNSNAESIITEISSRPQKGTKLLSLAGVLDGPKDMSSNKKKYL